MQCYCVKVHLSKPSGRLKLARFDSHAMKESRFFANLVHAKLAQLETQFRRARNEYPQAAKALGLLKEAIDAEVAPALSLGLRRKRRASGAAATGAPAAATGGDRDRKYYMQAFRLKKQNAQLKKEVQCHIATKAAGGKISAEWLMRVFLSQPTSSARALAQSFVDVAGSDVTTVGRTSIGKIRDAWVEMYKPMVLRTGADLVAFTVQGAAVAGAGFAPIFLLHVQDEADIRLRSSDVRDGPAMPSRSRASKVQQNCLTLFGAGQQQVAIPTELEALGDKTAPTLATSFERLLRAVAAQILPSPQAADLGPQPQAGPEVWMFHILVGDGINTNEAAAKILWSCMAEKQVGARYFLLLLKCATHQTGLSATSAVIGRAAAIAGGELYKAIAGVAARLFKYVICDYFEEFLFSVREWVVQDLIVQPAEEQGSLFVKEGIISAH